MLIAVIQSFESDSNETVIAVIAKIKQPSHCQASRQVWAMIADLGNVNGSFDTGLASFRPFYHLICIEA